MVKACEPISAVIFDVGQVLYHWEPRLLYERLIDDDRALDAFLRDIVSMEWHFQHDIGRPFAETSAELIARHPEHEALIRIWGERFIDSVQPAVAGMAQLVGELHEQGIALYGLTNFSAEFWEPFHAREAEFFAHFRDILVSGAEGLVKPDPAIYRLALSRFGLSAGETFFIDDREENVAAAQALGIRSHLFQDAATLRRALVAHRLLDAIPAL
ncbi:HAD family phosphatase [Sphingomonadales bacterium 56]|uniref:HAD family hydrolase n=1 Tax=unclassified Sphingobium TaxID=2611147 RepID=UPI00191AE74D|nr:MULTISPECIES: HAD family phosphatase [unclassified Sphingobium]MBY2928605.1 HAD family phosphatase [Sphingomonadales bacterium 56]MBY2959547.1 HAD family phosphatase [Sphingomonadales bacterium 58]CAD7337649.1 Alpha-D-glucose 1-phosphate phosphatase YihX [Sphingobium sp. S6]CAD7339209.1 Alpha-D-glucose 1-phosphate phosphatase YihX [Sphingobium sp. S8]